MNLSQVQCNSFVMQQNMSNPEEHCNLGFHSLVVDEGGAFHSCLQLEWMVRFMLYPREYSFSQVDLLAIEAL